jgi:hypothetical protein
MERENDHQPPSLHFPPYPTSVSSLLFSSLTSLLFFSLSSFLSPLLSSILFSSLLLSLSLAPVSNFHDYSLILSPQFIYSKLKTNLSLVLFPIQTLARFVLCGTILVNAIEGNLAQGAATKHHPCGCSAMAVKAASRPLVPQEHSLQRALRDDNGSRRHSADLTPVLATRKYPTTPFPFERRIHMLTGYGVFVQHRDPMQSLLALCRLVLS